MARLSIKRFAFLLIPALAVAARLEAGNGTVSALFLQENPSARQVAMGGVHTVNADAADAIHSNPAGLGLVGRPEVQLAYNSQQDTGNHGFAGYAQPIIKGASFRLTAGLGLIYYTAGNIDIHYSNGTPSKSLIAEYGYSGTFALGARFGRWLAVGLAPKYLKSTLVEQYDATATALDGGFMIFPFPELLNERVTVGGTFQNFGSKLTYRTAEQSLPETTALGAGANLFRHREFGSISASAQMEKTLGEETKYRVGTEYAFGLKESPWEVFARGGYRFRFETENYSFGVGIREKNIEINYAFVNVSSLDRTHRLTLSFRFGAYAEPRWKESLQKDSEDALKQSHHQMLNPDDLKTKPEEHKLIDLKDNKKSKTLMKDETGAEGYKLYKDSENQPKYELMDGEGE